MAYDIQITILNVGLWDWAMGTKQISKTYLEEQGGQGFQQGGEAPPCAPRGYGADGGPLVP